ncbi:aspartate--tRNA ligase [Chloroflexota bacterium]
MLKSHRCNELKKELGGQEVILAGWVHRRRDHGGLIFIDLRDRFSLVQLVFNPETAPACHGVAEQMRTEYVICVKGVVSARPEGTENPRLDTGEIEILVSRAEILNTSLTPPFFINEESEVDENLRLEYRYLDLRRERMKQNMILRHRVIKFMRDFLNERDFLEIETPILLKSTPEGARDYLVPSRLHRGEFYALPQSPQQVKQLLMVAGMERYYQVARCFRDEDSRADRQPEFTQLDIEMSFVEEEDMLGMIEEMYAGMFAMLKPECNITRPFPRLKYADVMSHYGSDKPDLRFGLELADLTEKVRNSEFGVFRNVVAGGGSVKGIAAPGCAGYSRQQIEELNRMARDYGAGGLVTIAIGEDAGDIASLSMDSVKSVAAKYLKIEEVRDIATATGANASDLLLIVAGDISLVNTVLGELRRYLGRVLKLAKAGEYAFAFVVDFPLFDRDIKNNRWQAAHHPFTMPVLEDIPLLDTDPGRVRARSYDFICNGSELSSGSIRVYQTAMQKKIFGLMGYSDAEVTELFGHLLEAFDYGAPPHGGIAPGIDRTVALLAGEESIREVIAFPKNQAAQDLTFGAPSPVSADQLNDLGLTVNPEE